MHTAQSTPDALTAAGGAAFTHADMQLGRLVLVLIGIVLVEGAYVRAGG